MNQKLLNSINNYQKISKDLTKTGLKQLLKIKNNFYKNLRPNKLLPYYIIY